MEQALNERKSNLIIGILSIVIPVAVAVLLFLPQRLDGGNWARALPHLNAFINTTTSIALLAGVMFIKAGKINYHRMCMTAAFCLGALFLVSYVLYHATIPSTRFGDLNSDGLLSAEELASVGSLRLVYMVLLLSHILLAVIVLPFVLRAMYLAWTRQFEKHRKVVKWAFPIWLYVSITGVVVYFMISPYYAF